MALAGIGGESVALRCSTSGVMLLDAGRSGGRGDAAAGRQAWCASLIMSQAAADAGLQALSVLAILIYVMQGFAGYPLTAIMLKREGRRVLDLHRAGRWQGVAPVADSADAPMPPAPVCASARRL